MLQCISTREGSFKMDDVATFYSQHLCGMRTTILTTRVHSKGSSSLWLFLLRWVFSPNEFWKIDSRFCGCLAWLIPLLLFRKPRFVTSEYRFLDRKNSLFSVCQSCVFLFPFETVRDLKRRLSIIALVVKFSKDFLYSRLLPAGIYWSPERVFPVPVLK